MAKITQEQITKINNMCSNEWELNTSYYLTHQVKELMKRIRLDEQHFLQFELGYNSRNQIMLRISKYKDEPQYKMATTSGMGKIKILVEASATRKDLNKLILLTKDLTEEKLLEINKNTPVASGYGIIVESEAF